MKGFVGACVIILLSISYLIGLLLFKREDSKKLYSFVESLGLIYFVLLIIFYIFPSCIDFLGNNYNLIQSYFYLFLMILLGIFIVKTVIYFLPKKNKILDSLNSSYVLLFIISALLLFIEGVFIYNNKSNYLNLFLLSVQLFIYNSFLGVIFVGNLKKHKFELIKCFKYLSFVSVFGLIGYLLSFNSNFLYKNSLFMGSLCGVFIGILSYLIIEVYIFYFRENSESNAKTLGLVVGGVLMLLFNLL